jgi:hypothetical protein
VTRRIQLVGGRQLRQRLDRLIKGDGARLGVQDRAAFGQHLVPAAGRGWGLGLNAQRGDARAVQEPLAVEEQDKRRRVRGGLVQFGHGRLPPFFELVG